MAKKYSAAVILQSAVAAAYWFVCKDERALSKHTSDWCGRLTQNQLSHAVQFAIAQFEKSSPVAKLMARPRSQERRDREVRRSQELCRAA
jgi:hypothetical protein